MSAFCKHVAKNTIIFVRSFFFSYLTFGFLILIDCSIRNDKCESPFNVLALSIMARLCSTGGRWIAIAFRTCSWRHGSLPSIRAIPRPFILKYLWALYRSLPPYLVHINGLSFHFFDNTIEQRPIPAYHYVQLQGEMCVTERRPSGRFQNDTMTSTWMVQAPFVKRKVFAKRRLFPNNLVLKNKRLVRPADVHVVNLA
jgi:hypothetical protein